MRTKICGVRTVNDALVAVAAGANAIGLNFHPPSPRFVEHEQARKILASLPPFVTPVAVLVQPSPEQIEHLWTTLGIVHYQLHAVDLASLLATLRAHHLRAIPACGVGAASDVANLLSDAQRWVQTSADVVEAVLVDAKSPASDVHGGTGQQAPWELLANVAWPFPLILAGGLTPENVAEAIRIVRPYAVDVASGVELSPGVKDAVRMRDFVRAAVGMTNDEARMTKE